MNDFTYNNDDNHVVIDDKDNFYQANEPDDIHPCFDGQRSTFYNLISEYRNRRLASMNQQHTDSIIPASSDASRTADVPQLFSTRMANSYLTNGMDFMRLGFTTFLDKSFNLNEHMKSVFDDICTKQQLPTHHSVFFSTGANWFGYILAELKQPYSANCLVTVHIRFTGQRYGERSETDTKGVADEINVTVDGEPKVVAYLKESLKTSFIKTASIAKRAVIKWRYQTDDGVEDTLMTIDKDWTMYPEAYPWLNEDLTAYYERYINSPASILIAYGPPGTGKTSFIRDLLCEQQVNAIVSYDAKILASDEMFTFFMNSPNYTTLVIEDADDLLTSERSENNKVIAKLLNTSDGLMRLPKKKIILSTNLENVSHIDEALVRPGRCFDMLNFRLLTNDEQHALAKAMGVVTGNGKMSVAEIFSKQTFAAPKTNKIGF